MPRQCKNETARKQQLVTTSSTTEDSMIDYCSAAMLPWPFEEVREKEKLYIVSDRKNMKTFYSIGNFQYQFTTKTNDMLEIGTTLNLQQFKVLLDVYSNFFSTLTATYY